MGELIQADKADDRDFDKPKDVADSVVARAPKPDKQKQDNDDKDDKLGALARSQSDPKAIRNSTDVIAASFHWLGQAAEQKVGELGEDLKKVDDPPWIESIAEGLLVSALGASTAAIGVQIAGKLVDAASSEATREFVKVLFENGLNAGIDAGKARLAGGSSDVSDAFINSQKEGSRATHMANQTQFLKVERDNIHTLEQAEALEHACSRPNLEAAALKHKAATRDAWLGYLAQAEFGAVGKHGAPRPGESTTTNMRSRESRKKSNESAPGFTPENAPDRQAVGRGDAPGVLAVAVELPAIVVDQMSGRPTVNAAVLNGVNEAIRAQYEGASLASANVPRLIVAKVAGQHPDFEIGIDEAGHSTYLNTQQDGWLRARAVVGHPENFQKDAFAQQQEGLKLLLKDLVPTHIKKNVGLL
jgi:hypothetical protein